MASKKKRVVPPVGSHGLEVLCWPDGRFARALHALAQADLLPERRWWTLRSDTGEVLTVTGWEHEQFADALNTPAAQEIINALLME